MNDLKNAAESIEKKMDAKSQQRGEELANQIIHGNLIGFLFARWFNFFNIIFPLIVIISLFNLNDFVSALVAFILALVILRRKFFWYMHFKYALLLTIIEGFLGTLIINFH